MVVGVWWCLVGFGEIRDTVANVCCRGSSDGGCVREDTSAASH